MHICVCLLPLASGCSGHRPCLQSILPLTLSKWWSYICQKTHSWDVLKAVLNDSKDFLEVWPPTSIFWYNSSPKSIKKDTDGEIYLFTSWKVISCLDVLGFESKPFPQSPLLDQVEMKSDSGSPSTSLTTQRSHSSPTPWEVGACSQEEGGKGTERR